MGGPCGFRIPMTRPVCARGAPKRRPSIWRKLYHKGSQTPANLLLNFSFRSFSQREGVIFPLNHDT